MPEEGVDLTEKGKLLSSEELVQIAKIFVDEGLWNNELWRGQKYCYFADIPLRSWWYATSHSAYVATATESNRAKIDDF